MVAVYQFGLEDAATNGCNRAKLRKKGPGCGGEAGLLARVLEQNTTWLKNCQRREGHGVAVRKDCFVFRGFLQESSLPPIEEIEKELGQQLKPHHQLYPSIIVFTADTVKYRCLQNKHLLCIIVPNMK